MLTTLLKLGQEISEGRSKWDDIILVPNIIFQTKKGDPITNYVLEIIFDIDNQEVVIEKENLHLYDPEKSPFDLMLMNKPAGNATKCYASIQLSDMKAFNTSLSIDFCKEIDNKYKHLNNSPFSLALQEIKRLMANPEINEKISEKYIKDAIGLNTTEKLIICYASIVNKSLALNEPKKLIELKGFNEYTDKKFFSDVKKSTKDKLCYVTGELSKNTIPAKFEDRKSLNKIFQSTQINYANDCLKENFSKNYQLTSDAEKYLERASKYLLKNNYKVYIAGIHHLIIPQFLNSTNINLTHNFSSLKSKSDLLFQDKNLEVLIKSIDVEVKDIYWLNYIGFKSDGQSFKIIHQIKDISKFYFKKIARTFKEVHFEFEEYLYSKNIFNFYTIYQIIPIKEIKAKQSNNKKYNPKIEAKKNEALSLFKDIFEKRKISSHDIFHHFCLYILCQRYKRHKTYPNILNFEKTQNKKRLPFEKAIEYGIKRYSLLLEVLRRLNLLQNNNKMEDQKISQNTDWLKQEEEFTIKMTYNQGQKSLFYLGRALNYIANAQAKKNHKKKPILGKINYNGLDKTGIIRLRKDLAEKSKQYNIHGLTAKPFSKFTEYFDFNAWNMNPEEAVFFLLAGYSFWSKNEDNNSTNENN